MIKVLQNPDLKESLFQSYETYEYAAEIYSEPERLPAQLNIIKNMCEENIMANGSTNPRGEFWFGDVMLFALLARHIMNPKLKEHIWEKLVVAGGHDGWIGKIKKFSL